MDVGRFQQPADETIRKVPIIGETEAGFPVLFCGESIEESEHQFKSIAITNFIGEEIFALKVKGFSMSPRILPDDIVILSSTRQAIPGDLCVTVNIDNESTLKILDSLDDTVVLKPLNPQYKVLVFNRERILQILPVISILATPAYS